MTHAEECQDIRNDEFRISNVDLKNSINFLILDRKSVAIH
jgi:hypothetical protein